MKELSIEEKAKRYDEAIERARDINSGCASYIPDGTPVIEAIFPELSESEDERIREELISFFTERAKYTEDSTFNGLSSKEIIAWLEKQSNDADNKFIRMRETKPKDISEFLDRLTTVEQEFLWEHIAKIRELDKEEQKPAVIIPKFRIGDYVKNVNDKREPIYEIVYMDKERYVCEYRGKENMGDKAVMHFTFDNPYLRLVEQNPAGNIEPKFKQGDIIKEKETGNLFYVNSVENFGYTLHYKNCIEKGCTLSFKYEDNYELVEHNPAWSEKDEINLEKAIWYVENPAPMVVKDSMLVEWLKNLRGRVQPRTNQELCEDDSEHLDSIIESYKYLIADYKAAHDVDYIPYDSNTVMRTVTNDVNFLESLKDRYTWEPSDAQMKALSDMNLTGGVTSPKQGRELITLYNDLKKLK